MTDARPQARTVACPHCKGPSLFAPGNPYRPFCSARCREIDLGAWASEAFKLPADVPPDPGQGPEDGNTRQ